MVHVSLVRSTVVPVASPRIWQTLGNALCLCRLEYLVSRITVNWPSNGKGDTIINFVPLSTVGFPGEQDVGRGNLPLRDS